MNLTLKALSNSIFAVIVVIGIIGLMLFIKYSRMDKEYGDLLKHTYVVSNQMSELLSRLKDAETGQRGFLLTNDDAYLEPFYSGRDSALSLRSELKEISHDNSSQQERLGILEQLTDQKLNELEETIRLRRENNVDEALALVRSNVGKGYMDQIRVVIEEFVAEENSLLQDRETIRNDAQKLFETAFISFIFIGCVISLVGGYLINKIITSPLARLSDKMSRIGAGEEVTFDAGDFPDNEIGNLAEALSRLDGKVKLRTAELEHHRSSLEEQVDAQTKDLKRLLEAAEAANVAKDNFLANMSHEFRSPLNGIYGGLQLLEDEDLSPSVQDLVRMASTSCKNLTATINDILDFSKMVAGKIELDEIPFSFKNETELLQSNLGALANSKKIQFIIKNELNHDVWLGDPIKINQILLNLCANAVKFTNEGQVELRLCEATEYEGVDVTITDTGIGMSPDQLVAVFERFQQADNSIGRTYGGTGLGLSICSGLIDLMNGRITATSKLGEGTAFSVAIPVMQAESIKSDQPERGLVRNHDKKRILLAENDQVNQMIFKRMVKKNGLDPIICENGQIALEMIKKEMPDLVFLDIHMPVLDGMEACKEIRKKSIDVPIVALTASVMTKDVERYYKNGFDAHIPKPYCAADLQSVLNKYLS